MKQSMTFISYAQNFEDVMLWRALRHVEKGFYVDVGAMDPIVDSTTQAFYERGWRGINIEPASSYYEKLSRSRPLDINLPFAISDVEGMMKFYEIPETGLSTLDSDIARMHQESDVTVIEKQVPVVTLNQILAQHVKGPIHFMKIDVEGGERNVLQGLDLSLWRPWIIVIEATKPNSAELNSETWEGRIVTAGYDIVYFDGLNRFYVAHEHSDLAEKFRLPPNVFDNFIVDELYFMTADRDAIRADRNRIQIERDRMEIERDSIKTQLDDIYYTLSWRITRPLRELKDAVRGIQHVYETMIKSGLRKSAILRHAPSDVKAELNNFSQRAQTIYYDLLSAIQERNSGE
jgi:FkbM family methyltransferase